MSCLYRGVLSKLARRGRDDDVASGGAEKDRTDHDEREPGISPERGADTPQQEPQVDGDLVMRDLPSSGILPPGS